MNEPEPESAPEAPAPEAPGPHTVVVLASQPELREELMHCLQALGHSALDFADLRSFLHSGVADRTRMLVLGISIVNQAPLEQCRLLRQNPELQHIPVLVCAPEATRELLLHAVQAGAQGFAVHPFDQTLPTHTDRLLKAA